MKYSGLYPSPFHANHVLTPSIYVTDPSQMTWLALHFFFFISGSLFTDSLSQGELLRVS